MADLPSRTATFLFADIGGSARLSEQLGSRYADVLVEFQRLLRVAAHNQDGREIGTHGGGCCFAFPRAGAALLAAVAALRAVQRYPWPAGVSPPARMGLHTGEAIKGHKGVELDRAAGICAAGHGGQILLSQTTYDLVADSLPREIRLRDLGRYRLKDLGTAQTVFQVVAAGLAAEFPPLRSLDAFPNNLPRQVASFIGREREMAEVKRLLSATCLLTLTGAGGCGKTRLALQVVADLLERYPDGVWLVELASLSDPTLVLPTVASALCVSEQPNRSLNETLVDHLRPRALLLILDNCEHVLPACAQLADTILRTCPGLRILATSREPLRTAGEVFWRVPSLSLPDPRRLPELERLREYEAVRLFAERARDALPAFAVTSQNGRAVTHACHRLDGIPLAIELAAARVKMLDVEQIVARLDDRFRLLTRGNRTAPPRQQTLRATMDWSYDLLTEKERALLRGLSVFAGGFTLEAAEAICGNAGAGEFEVLDVLTSLVDKSLVIAEEQNGVVRYRLLETVRQYAREKLVEPRAVAEVHRRHRDFFLRLAEEAEPYLTVGEANWIDRLETEHDNLRGALEWSREAEGRSHRLAGLRIAGALGRFWEVRGYLAEGRERLGGFLSGSQDLGETNERGRALTVAGRLAFFQGDNHAARLLLEESVAVYRRLGDKSGLALALNNLGPVPLNEGDYAAARLLYEESLAIRREIGDKQGAALSLSNLGLAARCQGEYERARAILEQCLVLFEEMRHDSGKAYSLTHLGVAEYCAGNADRAGALLKESLALFGKQGSKRLVAEGLVMLAGVECVQGHPQRAATLYGGAQALYDTTGASVWIVNRRLYERDLAATRTQLGADAFDAAWDRGRAMTLEQAIEFALAPSEGAPLIAKGKEKSGLSGGAGLLSARELEVATLVARGLSNPEIASRLVITLRTAQTHVQNILNKLGVTSRAQIAAWAVENGLHTPGGPRQ